MQGYRPFPKKSRMSPDGISVQDLCVPDRCADSVLNRLCGVHEAAQYHNAVDDNAVGMPVALSAELPDALLPGEAAVDVDFAPVNQLGPVNIADVCILKAKSSSH